MKKFGPQKARPASLLGLVLTTMVGLVLLWIIFLVYCWQHGSMVDVPDLNEVNNILNKTEEFILNEVHMAEDLAHMRPGHNLVHHVGPRKVVNKMVATNNNAEPPKPPPQVHNKEEGGGIHVIFSTDCTPYQDWQTLTLFHSAMVVGQKGHITRIASGCDEEKQKKLTDLYAKLYPQYYVHFTPDFKKDEKTGKKYDFYNKPWGTVHWLEHANPPVEDDVVVALLDPDMIFLRPITGKLAGVPDHIYAKKVDKREIVDRVKEGHPAAQLYGLGAPWTNDHHKKFNRTYICGEHSPCLKPNDVFGSRHYSVGPPYLVHKNDMIKIGKTWTKFVPRVYEHYPYLLAEMYAYSMAAAHENLPHLQLENWMVSNTDVHPGEGWPHVDALEDSCMPPDSNGIYYPGQNLPTVMHFCQFFRAGDFGFQKRRVPKDIFTCDQRMFAEPYANLSSATYRIKNKVREDLKPRQAKRHAFAIGVLHRSINAAISDYKDRMCGPDANREKSLIIVA